MPCPVGVQGPVLEAIVCSRTVGKLAQVGAAVVFIDEPEGTSRGLPLLQPARSSHEVVEARQSRGLECAVWRRACGKVNVEMNSRLGDGVTKNACSGKSPAFRSRQFRNVCTRGYYSFDHDVRLPRSGRGAAVAGLRVCSLAQSMWKSECRNEFPPWRWSTPWIKKCRPRKALYFSDGLPLGRGAPVQCWI